VKSTGRPLVDQGLSNRTSILHAKLGGLWTTRRADFIETGWKCDPANVEGPAGGQEEIWAEAVIEVSGLSLEVVERLDISLNKGHKLHQLAAHKPCKLFQLPSWMCRDQKPVYRSISTWVNRAYFRLKLLQQAGQNRPKIAELELMFTCPETFRQKITYSPSATYVLSRHLRNQSGLVGPSRTSKRRKRRSRSNSKDSKQTKRAAASRPATEAGEHLDSSHTILQSGRLPAVPPYHYSVRLIERHTLEALRSAFGDCLQLLDIDLALMSGRSSFTHTRYNHPTLRQSNVSQPIESPDESVVGECSNRFWVRNRMELHEQASSLMAKGERAPANQATPAPKQWQLVGSSHSKRNKYLLDYPADPNQLLNPYGYYQESSALDLMIDD